MELKEPVLKIINKIYEPSSMVELTFKRYHLALKTDEKGRAILLFMGKKKENNEGEAIKDHWEHKGKAT